MCSQNNIVLYFPTEQKGILIHHFKVGISCYKMTYKIFSTKVLTLIKRHQLSYTLMSETKYKSRVIRAYFGIEIIFKMFVSVIQNLMVNEYKIKILSKSSKTILITFFSHVFPNDPNKTYWSPTFRGSSVQKTQTKCTIACAISQNH